MWIIIYTTKIRAYPHSIFIITKNGINSIVRKSITVIAIRNCKMNIIILNYIVYVKPMFCANPKLCV